MSLLKKSCRTVFLFVAAVSAVRAAGDPVGVEITAGRERDLVTVSGAALAPLQGSPVADIAVYRYAPETGLFDPVPFQIDERFLKVFDPGMSSEFSEMVYDVFGEDDGIFDANDEIVFLTGDGGARAPLDGTWVEGASEIRYELLITDPRPTAPDPPRWLYVYTGPGLPRSTAAYVSWNGLPNAGITTDAFRIDPGGNWTVNGLTVFGPCGSGLDLLDRFKGRAEPGSSLPRQDEEDWSANSTYLGGYAGPVRAIRYVRGARSGVNTILRDVVEPSRWNRRVNLRVHPVNSVWVYLDWLPEPNATLFTPASPIGLPIDGVPDAGVSTAFVPWHLVRSSSGGLFVAWDVPQSPLYSTREFFYLDDVSHDDMVPTKTSYPDDDDSAYGDHGVKILGTQDSSVNPIRIAFRATPLCAGEGDLDLALALQERNDLPPLAVALPQADCSAIRTMVLSREGPNIRLTWEEDPSADGYRVYTSNSASLDRSSWTQGGNTVIPTFVDVNGATGNSRYYSVVCKRGAGEGPW